MLRYPAAIIFDWDNTLVDSWPAIAEAMNITRAAMGHETWSFDQIRQNCTRAARDSFPAWFGDEWERAYEIYYKGFDEVRKRRALQPMRGAPELLQTIRTLAIPAFVVSNKRGDYLRHEVERLNWQGYFAAVAGAQDAPRDKPAREHVDYALRESGLSPNSAIWFIGDSETDVLCARNAGCLPMLVGDRDEAAKLGVSHVFVDCHGVLNMLNQLTKER